MPAHVGGFFWCMHNSVHGKLPHSHALIQLDRRLTPGVCVCWPRWKQIGLDQCASDSANTRGAAVARSIYLNVSRSSAARRREFLRTMRRTTLPTDGTHTQLNKLWYILEVFYMVLCAYWCGSKRLQARGSRSTASELMPLIRRQFTIWYSYVHIHLAPRFYQKNL